MVEDAYAGIVKKLGKRVEEARDYNRTEYLSSYGRGHPGKATRCRQKMEAYQRVLDWIDSLTAEVAETTLLQELVSDLALALRDHHTGRDTLRSFTQTYDRDRVLLERVEALEGKEL